MELSLRLQAAADYVKKGSNIADIGTDHGKLPMYLVKENIARTAFACDVNDGPLEIALKNITAEGLDKKIQIIKSDGLKNLDGDSIDTIIICGMGGELITSILENCPWNIKDAGYNFILQPMTREADLRRSLYKMGFEITDETPIKEGRHIYTVMRAVYCGKTAELSHISASVGKITSQGDGRYYLLREVKRAEDKIKKFSHLNDAEEVAKWQKICNDIEELI